MNTISFLMPDDLATAWQIEQASHAFPWSEQVLRSNQGSRYLNLKCDVDKQMAGFAITQLVLDEATLFNVAVAPPFQRQGIGRSLLLALIDQLQQRTISNLWLEVRASNQAAIHLYDALGFNEVTRRANYYPASTGREDAIIMVLPMA